MIDRLTIDRIFASADIAEVVGEFVTLKKKGVNYTACCPFHNEKTPSFIVSPAKGLYKCFGCGKGGNSVSFVMEHEKLTYPEALRWMAKKYGITIEEKELTEQEKVANNDRESMMVLNSWASDFFAQQLMTDDGKNIALAYFKERGFTDKTIRKFGLGYNSERSNPLTAAALKEGYKADFLLKTGLSGSREDGTLYDKYYGRVIFPIHSLAGRVLGFGGRTMRTDKKTAKYINSPESEIYHKSHTLYGIFFAKKAIVANNKCILVEGYTDVMQMHQSGIEHVVASSGTSLTTEQIKLIKRFTQNVTVIYDGDSAGIKASLRGIDMILSEGMAVRVVPLPEGDDPDSFAKTRSSTEIEDYITHNEEDFLSFKIKMLLGAPDSSDSNDPVKRAELIGDIVRSIAVIPDPIRRSVYVRECSRTMDVPIETLENEVRRRIATNIDGAAGRSVVDNRIRKDRYQNQNGYNTSRGSYGSSDGPDPGIFAPDEAFTAPKVDPSHKVQQEIANLEGELMGYLIKYGDREFEFENTPTDIISLGVASTIIEELRADEIVPQTGVYKTIFEYFCKRYDAGDLPSVNDFINNENQDVSLFVVDMLTRDDIHRVSTIWEKREIKVYSEGELLSSAIPKALTIYKSKVISVRLADLQTELQTMTEMTERVGEIMEEMGRLNGIRTALLAKYQRFI